MCEKDKFEMEYYLQQITNNHLKYLFELEFITSEFQLPGLENNNFDCDEKIGSLNDDSENNEKTKSLRIDGLAFNNKTKSFVIIEYKNKFDRDVIDQGKCYYKNLQEKKSCYVKKYNEICDRDCKEEDFDFSKTKVMIIGPTFSKKQIDRNKNPDYPFELHKVSLCKINERLSRVSYKKINLGPKKDDAPKELYVSSEDLKITRCSLLENKSTEVKELYKDFEDRLFEHFKKDFILDIRYIVDAVSIKAHGEYICRIIVNKNSIKIHYYCDEKEDETLNQGNIGKIIGSIDDVYRQKVGKNDI